MKDTEFWLLGMGRAKQTAQTAKMLENYGWDGMQLTDTQCLANDAFIELAMAVAATDKIKLSTGVTNPVTRDASVTASSIATLQEESDGRVELVIGRGDSSLGHIGQEEGVKLADLHDYIVKLQAYLRGETIDRNGFPSALRWMEDRSFPKVPVHVAGTGPKVTQMAANYGDGISIAGFAWSIETLKEKIQKVEDILEREGKPRDEFKINLYMACALNEDDRIAQEMIRGAVATGSRFSGMTKAALTEVPEGSQDIVKRIADEYDMLDHLKAKTRHAQNIPDEYVRRTAIVGTPEQAIERFQEYMELPIDSISIMGGSRDADPELVKESLGLISTQVLPKLRAA